jgi:ribosomal-protein-alanine N-acetyltransferase
MARAIEYPEPALVLGAYSLRPLRVEDFDAAREATDHPSSARWINTLPASDGRGLVDFVEMERTAGRILDLAIADGAGDYLGEVLLLSREHQSAELAYLIAPAARGQGIATAAVDALSRYAFERLAMQRLQIRVDPGNAASQRVAEKAGYQREGLMRSALIVRGRRADVLVYSRLPSDPSP